jgi:hypothetical protein
MRHLLSTAAAMLVAGSLTFAANPARAADDSRCTRMPEQVRSALAGAEGPAAAQAARRLRSGEQLCRAKNERAAAREFQVALRLLERTGAATGFAATAK